MKRENKKPKKVLVALSGGVDSAIAAAQLAKQGHKVVGIFFDMGVWGKRGLRNAKMIASTLKIPLKIIDARKKFKKKIIDYFINSYKKGLTPNPCVVCNKAIKFDLLFELLKKENADYVSTGHYARILPVIARSEATKQSQVIQKSTRLLRFARNDRLKLHEARDKSKDQSYFLYKLTQKDLSKIIFPLGDFKKTEVKKIAKKLNLPVLDEEESQDVCFLLDQDINYFLKRHIKAKSGDIVDDRDVVLGKHKGLPFYTIGQRRGIEIGGRGPYFVIEKNAKKNELIVSGDPKRLMVNKFEASNANWINPDEKFPLKAQVQIRYHADKVSAIIRKKDPPATRGTYEVSGKKPFRAVTRGQSAAFSKRGEILGGGIII